MLWFQLILLYFFLHSPITYRLVETSRNPLKAPSQELELYKAKNTSCTKVKALGAWVSKLSRINAVTLKRAELDTCFPITGSAMQKQVGKHSSGDISLLEYSCYITILMITLQLIYIFDYFRCTIFP